MKFVTLFAVGAVASLAPRAQVDTIKDDIQAIRQQVQSFTTTIEKFSEDNMDTVRSDLKDIILAINAADGDTKGLKGTFSDRDATALATPIQDLGIDVGKSMDALIAKKPALVAKCHGPEIYQALADQSMQSAAFQKDLMKRLSPDVQTLAKQMAKPFNDNMAKGLTAFTDQQNVKCAAPKPPKSTSSIYGSVPSPTDGPSNSNTNTQQSSSSNPNTSKNGTSPSYTTGPAPTSSIIAGSASTFGASLGFACLTALAFLAL